MNKVRHKYDMSISSNTYKSLNYRYLQGNQVDKGYKVRICLTNIVLGHNLKLDCIGFSIYLCGFQGGIKSPLEKP